MMEEVRREYPDIVGLRAWIADLMKPTTGEEIEAAAREATEDTRRIIQGLEDA